MLRESSSAAPRGSAASSPSSGGIGRAAGARRHCAARQREYQRLASVDAATSKPGGPIESAIVAAQRESTFLPLCVVMKRK